MMRQDGDMLYRYVYCRNLLGEVLPRMLATLESWKQSRNALPPELAAESFEPKARVSLPAFVPRTRTTAARTMPPQLHHVDVVLASVAVSSARAAGRATAAI